MPTLYDAPLDRLESGLDGLAAIDPGYRSTGEKSRALVRLARLRARLAAEEMRLVSASDDIAIETGARSTAAWLAHETRDAHGATQRAAVLARALDRRWARVGAALAAGSVNVAQARVMVEALDALPEDLDRELRAKAEGHLVAEAGHFGPHDLRRLGGRLLEAVAPDLADEVEYRRLVDEERRAHAATRISFRPRGDGSTDVHARLPDPVAHRLRAYCDALAAPRRGPLGEVDRLPLVRRRGQAFVALLEQIPDAGLPRHGGTATSVLVTLDLDVLRSGTGAAGTSTGDRITAEHARRLACTARIIPVVLGRRGEVLDLGRSARLFSPAQRKAMALRDRECTAQDCSIPAAWCEAHHWRKPWSQGGRTDLADGKLLCSFHHHRAHDPGWRTCHQPNGSTTFHRRT